MHRLGRRLRLHLVGSQHLYHITPVSADQRAAPGILKAVRLQRSQSMAGEAGCAPPWPTTASASGRGSVPIAFTPASADQHAAPGMLNTVRLLNVGGDHTNR